jgi:hypothetical protein
MFNTNRMYCANVFNSFSARKKPVPYQRVNISSFFFPLLLLFFFIMIIFLRFWGLYHLIFLCHFFSAHPHGVHLAQQKALTLHGEAILVHPVCNSGVRQAVRLVALVLALVLVLVLALVLALVLVPTIIH